MRMRTFTAPDMNRAMLMIRETLGEDAVIISSQRDSSGKAVSVTAAIDDEWAEEPEAEEEFEEPEFNEVAEWENGHDAPAEPYTKPPLMSHEAILKNRDLAYLLHEIEKVLSFHSVPLPLIEKILRAAKYVDFSAPRSQDGVYEGLIDLLSHLYRFEPLALEHQPERIMLVGPPGVGKTMAAAKLAANLVADKLPIHVLTIDNKRAGGVEQLRAFTSIMGIQARVADCRNELRRLLKEIPNDEPVVIDSFATNPYSFDELRELNEFANLHKVEPVLVFSAGCDAQEAADIARAFAFMGTKRMLVSRTDTARRYGALLAAGEAGDLALCQLTHSAQVAGGLEQMHPATLADMLMQFKNDH